MIPSSEDIYRSQNGDTWRLIRDAKSGRVFVRHEANPSSGGHITEPMSKNFFVPAAPSMPAYAIFLEKQLRTAGMLPVSPRSNLRRLGSC